MVPIRTPETLFYLLSSLYSPNPSLMIKISVLVDLLAAAYSLMTSKIGFTCSFVEPLSSDLSVGFWVEDSDLGLGFRV